MFWRRRESRDGGKAALLEGLVKLWQSGMKGWGMPSHWEGQQLQRKRTGSLKGRKAWKWTISQKKRRFFRKKYRTFRKAKNQTGIMKMEGRWGDCKDNDGNIIIMVKTMIIIMIIMVTTIMMMMMMMMQSAILCCPLPGISQRVRLRLGSNKKDKTAGRDRLEVFSLSPWKQISSTSSAAASRLTPSSPADSRQKLKTNYDNNDKDGDKISQWCYPMWRLR